MVLFSSLPFSAFGEYLVYLTVEMSPCSYPMAKKTLFQIHAFEAVVVLGSPESKFGLEKTLMFKPQRNIQWEYLDF